MPDQMRPFWWHCLHAYSPSERTWSCRSYRARRGPRDSSAIRVKYEP